MPTTLNMSQNNFIKLVKAATGLDCMAEWRFHPSRKWRFDYAIPAARVAVEVEGGVFTGGRHTTGAGFTADLEKYNTAESMGWHVLRITPDVLCAPVTIKLVADTVKAVGKQISVTIEQHAACPYGRKAIVGDQRCVNCIFNVMINTKCLGTSEAVKKHQENLGLEY